MFIHAFRFLSYINLHFGHLYILPLTWATCPHLWQVFEVFFDEPLFKVHDVYSLEESPIFNVGLEFSEGSGVKPLV
jgi:hypothetical protein